MSYSKKQRLHDEQQIVFDMRARAAKDLFMASKQDYVNLPLNNNGLTVTIFVDKSRLSAEEADDLRWDQASGLENSMVKHISAVVENDLPRNFEQSNRTFLPNRFISLVFDREMICKVDKFADPVNMRKKYADRETDYSTYRTEWSDGTAYGKYNGEVQLCFNSYDEIIDWAWIMQYDKNGHDKTALTVFDFTNVKVQRTFVDGCIYVDFSPVPHAM